MLLSSLHWGWRAGRSARFIATLGGPVGGLLWGHQADGTHPTHWTALNCGSAPFSCYVFLLTTCLSTTGSVSGDKETTSAAYLVFSLFKLQKQQIRFFSWKFSATKKKLKSVLRSSNNKIKICQHALFPFPHHYGFVDLFILFVCSAFLNNKVVAPTGHFALWRWAVAGVSRESLSR